MWRSSVQENFRKRVIAVDVKIHYTQIPDEIGDSGVELSEALVFEIFIILVRLEGDAYFYRTYT